MDVGGVAMKCVVVAPSSLKDAANQLAQSFGYGPNNFSVPLSADGSEPATHYGGNAEGGISQTFKTLIDNALIGVVPSDIEEITGLTQQEVTQLVSSLTIDFNNSWNVVLTDLNIQPILSDNT